MEADFETIRRELLGLSQTQIVEVFGKPDAQLLYARNQKFYVYFLEPGEQCRGNDDASHARAVAIRFGALDNVTEVTYERGKPQ